MITITMWWWFSANQQDVKRQLHQGAATSSPGDSNPDPLSTWLTAAAHRKPNVLFVIADDLRPLLGSYSRHEMVTPNIDHLATKSVMFKKAYAQVRKRNRQTERERDRQTDRQADRQRGKILHIRIIVFKAFWAIYKFGWGHRYIKHHGNHVI